MNLQVKLNQTTSIRGFMRVLHEHHQYRAFKRDLMLCFGWSIENGRDVYDHHGNPINLNGLKLIYSLLDSAESMHQIK